MIRRSPIAELLRGLGQLLRGAGLVLRTPKRFALGLVPPFLVGTVFLVLFGVLVWQSDGIASALTPNPALQALIAVALLLASALLMVVLFSATTLAAGAPLYDLISEDVDRAEGWTGAAQSSGLAAVGYAVRRLASVLAVSVPVGLLLLLVGLVPVVGGIAATLGSALFGGWMIALEMVGPAAERRGLMTLGQRHSLLLRNRWLAWGYGIPTFLALSVPLLAILVFPAATAGGTLLARRLLDLPERR